jgi:hypothetical protein
MNDSPNLFPRCIVPEKAAEQILRRLQKVAAVLILKQRQSIRTVKGEQ